MIALLFTLTLQAAPIAPPLPQTVADCNQPTYATDQLVCADPVLRAADRELASVMASVPTARVAGRWIENQEAWFRRSRRCAFQADHARCVAAAYRERSAVLTALRQEAPVTTGECRLTDGGRAGSTQVNDVTVLVGSGQVIAVAMPAGRNWTSFIAVSGSGRTSVLQNLTGAVVARCTIKAKRGEA